MAHFAKLNENNDVIAVHVVNNDVVTIDGNESEQAALREVCFHIVCPCN